MLLGACSSYAWVLTGLNDVSGRGNRVRHVLCPTQLRPPIQAVTQQKLVSHKEECVSSRHLGWRRCGGGWAGPLFCDLGDGRIRKTQLFLLLDLPEVRVFHDTWIAWTPVPFPGNQALSASSTFSSGNSRLAGAWFWRQSHETGKSLAAAGVDHEVSRSSEW